MGYNRPKKNMKKLLLFFVAICCMFFAAKADNPPTYNENSNVSVSEEISNPERPSCIPEGWRYDGTYIACFGASCYHTQVWSSNVCGEKEYKVYLEEGRECLKAYYDRKNEEMYFYERNNKYTFKF